MYSELDCNLKKFLYNENFMVSTWRHGVRALQNLSYSKNPEKES